MNRENFTRKFSNLTIFVGGVRGKESDLDITREGENTPKRRVLTKRPFSREVVKKKGNCGNRR